MSVESDFRLACVNFRNATGYGPNHCTTSVDVAQRAVREGDSSRSAGVAGTLQAWNPRLTFFVDPKAKAGTLFVSRVDAVGHD